MLLDKLIAMSKSVVVVFDLVLKGGASDSGFRTLGDGAARLSAFVDLVSLLTNMPSSFFSTLNSSSSFPDFSFSALVRSLIALPQRQWA